MPTNPVAKKLRIQPVGRILPLNRPSHHLGLLGELPEEVRCDTQPDGEHAAVHLFAEDATQLAALRQIARRVIVRDGPFWVCYPKKSGKIKSGLSRDVVWKLMDGSGMRPVTQFSFDETWSALRFRPEEMV